MKVALTIAVLLAAVSTVLVAVCLEGENRRLEYRVWDAMRRRDSLERQLSEVQAAIDEVLSPRRLLTESDGRTAAAARPPSGEGTAE